MNLEKYSVANMTSFESNKNTSALAREIGVHQSTASRFLKKLDVTDSDFMPLVQTIFGNKKLTCIVDDVVISKRYATQIEGTSSLIDQSTKTFTNAYKLVTAGLTDGTYFLPISLEQWVAQSIMQKDYLSTTDLAQKLVTNMLNLGSTLEYFVLDGLYFSKDFIRFLSHQKIKFVIKAKTTTSVMYKGEKMQLQHCKDLRLNSNQNQKKIVAEWDGTMFYFIACRRTGKHGSKIIYLIANFNAKAKVYARIYKVRWNIEKFFRTAKQSLGLKNSFSLNASIYLNHIKCIFFTYCRLQLLMKKFKLHSIEDTLRRTQALKCRVGFAQTVELISLLEFDA